MKFYDCPTCHAMNHVGRLHCQVCGAVPAQYSMTGKTELSIAPANGCERQGSRPVQHLRFATVAIDYYAGA